MDKHFLFFYFFISNRLLWKADSNRKWSVYVYDNCYYPPFETNWDLERGDLIVDSLNGMQKKV